MSDIDLLNNKKKFLIIFDSDGTVFDVMELKHKECFIPNIIDYWNLQSIAKYARETAEFVNLYSAWRGVHRFPAYIKMLDLLGEREEVKKRKFIIPKMNSLREWVVSSEVLSNESLEKVIEKKPGDDLIKTLAWSKASNAAIAKIVRGVAPFPCVEESLDRLSSIANIAVVSSAQKDALHRGWLEHGLTKYVDVIMGQEDGSKSECIRRLMLAGYLNNNVLMVGDALGDLEAAEKNGILFYPINPGAEDDSWQQFYDQAMTKFLEDNYKGQYQTQLINNFNCRLPLIPPWKEKYI